MFYKNKPVPLDMKTPIAPGAHDFRVPEKLRRTRELQAHFLATDGKIPIFMAKGPMDVMAYRGTMGLCGIGLGYFGYLMYRMAYGLK